MTSPKLTAVIFVLCLAVLHGQEWDPSKDVFFHADPPSRDLVVPVNTPRTVLISSLISQDKLPSECNFAVFLGQLASETLTTIKSPYFYATISPAASAAVLGDYSDPLGVMNIQAGAVEGTSVVHLTAVPTNMDTAAECAPLTRSMVVRVFEPEFRITSNLFRAADIGDNKTIAFRLNERPFESVRGTIRIDDPSIVTCDDTCEFDIQDSDTDKWDMRHFFTLRAIGHGETRVWIQATTAGFHQTTRDVLVRVGPKVESLFNIPDFDYTKRMFKGDLGDLSYMSCSVSINGHLVNGQPSDSLIQGIEYDTELTIPLTFQSTTLTVATATMTVTGTANGGVSVYIEAFAFLGSTTSVDFGAQGKFTNVDGLSTCVSTNLGNNLRNKYVLKQLQFRPSSISWRIPPVFNGFARITPSFEIGAGVNLCVNSSTSWVVSPYMSAGLDLSLYGGASTGWLSGGLYGDVQVLSGALSVGLAKNDKVCLGSAFELDFLSGEIGGQITILGATIKQPFYEFAFAAAFHWTSCIGCYKPSYYWLSGTYCEPNAQFVVNQDNPDMCWVYLNMTSASVSSTFPPTSWNEGTAVMEVALSVAESNSWDEQRISFPYNVTRGSVNFGTPKTGYNSLALHWPMTVSKNVVYFLAGTQYLNWTDTASWLPFVYTIQVENCKVVGGLDTIVTSYIPQYIYSPNKLAQLNNTHYWAHRQDLLKYFPMNLTPTQFNTTLKRYGFNSTNINANFQFSLATYRASPPDTRISSATSMHASMIAVVAVLLSLLFVFV